MMDERYLDLLAEECAEVIQAIMKIKRFGINDLYPDGRTGREGLLDEIGDVFTVLDNMEFSGFEKERIERAQLLKEKKLKIYGPDGTYLKEKNK